MPLRLAAGRALAAQPLTLHGASATAHLRRFHASLTRASDFAKQNHYERLGIHHDASPGEIKKSFYLLSKSHHPDVNPAPGAAQNFSLLSEAYNVLSDASRRAQYDRDVLRLHHPHHHHHHASPPAGSYHSTTAHQHQHQHQHHAGGRPPSGLSKRRGTFRGPPPSFYRSGGWGAHADKRRQAHEESTATSTSSSARGDPWKHFHQAPGQAQGGMGPGSSPFGAGRPDDDVPHFDRRAHARTHQRQDERRHERRRAMGDDDVEFEPQTSLAGHFFIIMGILAATMVAPLVYLQFMRLGRRNRDGV
ncbi:Heat shock protein DnaJ, partial [Metarhizium brunneum ARSEF 3297]